VDLTRDPSLRLKAEQVPADTRAVVVVSLLVFLIVFVNWPAYKVGSRLGVPNSGLAFIPGVGPYIVMLRSIRSSAWATLLAFVPLVGVGFAVWLAYAVPTRHGRSPAWCLWFLLPGLNALGFWAYALTLEPPVSLTPAYSIGAGPMLAAPGPSSSSHGPVFKD